MKWKLEESTSVDCIILLARNTETMEGREMHCIPFPTCIERLMGSKRYAKQRLSAIKQINSFCADMESTEILHRVVMPDLPDKPLTCGKCDSDSWKLIARRWSTGHCLQFHCAECGHSDNIISYESMVSDIEKLVDADMLPNGSQYNPDVVYVSGKGTP